MTVQTLAQGFDSYREWAADRRPRIGFGMDWFDGPTGGGLARSEIAMLMAFSGVGKTTIALNVIRMNPDIPILFFSMEMKLRYVAARLAAMELPSSTQQLESRIRQGDHIPELQAVADRYRGFVCDDKSDMSLKMADESWEHACEQLGTEPRLVIWDYMGQISGGGMLGGAEKVEKVAMKLRNWTKDHDCASLVLHQVTKADGPWEPLSMESGKYGGYEPMDYVVGAYAPALNPELSGPEYERRQEELMFQLLKSRAGMQNPRGVKYRKDASNMRITPWTDLYQRPVPYNTSQPELPTDAPEPALADVGARWLYDNPDEEPF